MDTSGKQLFSSVRIAFRALLSALLVGLVISLIRCGSDNSGRVNSGTGGPFTVDPTIGRYDGDNPRHGERTKR
jgi:hypothetical protein